MKGQGEFRFEEAGPIVTALLIQAKPKPPLTAKVFNRQYRQEWRTAFAALGGCDAAGWMQDLCLYYDLQWNVATGEVGPTRWFIAPLILHPPFDCREIHGPESWNIHRVWDAIHAVTRFRLIGLAACNWRNMIYRTADVSLKRRKRDQKARKKFCYEDRTSRCGNLHFARGARIVWDEAA